jgi:hypothetical protein
MVVVDDDCGTSGGRRRRDAPSFLKRMPGLGQAARPGWRGGSRCGVPSSGPNWPVFSTDEYGPCWTCVNTPSFSARRVLVT